MELADLATDMEVVLEDGHDRLVRMSLRALPTSDRAEHVRERLG
ncbi:hypothetical protein [Streptomyces ferrugineus]|nr:hypothetical protein [Streptomyces ferrugineus]